MITRLRSRFGAWLCQRLRAAEPLPPTVLRTERLLLRDLEAEDLPALLAYRTDPAVLRYLDRVEPFIEQEIWCMIYAARRQRWQPTRTHYTLGILLQEEERLIGECSLALMAASDTPESPDAAAMGFMVHQDHWGCGYATEAARAIVRFAFEELGLFCVYAGCLRENVASRRVLEKAGLSYQGTQVDFPGSPRGVASLVFCIRREEWPGGNGERRPLAVPQEAPAAPTNDPREPPQGS